MRRRRDSNPWYAERTTVFKTAAIDHSATPPNKLGKKPILTSWGTTLATHMYIFECCFKLTSGSECVWNRIRTYGATLITSTISNDFIKCIIFPIYIFVLISRLFIWIPYFQLRFASHNIRRY